jgi:alpha-beta hydrolase superfamily lysophospholipase
MEVIELGGRDGRTVRAAWWESGAASEAVLYLNGLESNHTWFAAIAEKLNGLGTAVLALDRRGSGLNQDLRAGLKVWLEDIGICLDFIRRKYPEARVHLASLCFGAKLAAI